MQTMPRKFFGYALADIRTPEDAVEALRNFCVSATHDEIFVARQELRQLRRYQPEVYNAINAILFNLEFPLDTTAWDNRFLLINAGL